MARAAPAAAASAVDLERAPGGAMIAWAFLHRTAVPVLPGPVAIAPIFAPRSPAGREMIGVLVGGAL